MRYPLIILSLIVLAGCASTGLTEEGEKAYFEAQREAANEPIMSISCPESGCAFSSLTVNNPGNNNIRSLQVSSPAVEVTKALLNTATAVAPWAAVGHIAVEGINAAQGDQSSVVRDSGNTNTTTSETTETSRVTEDNDTTTRTTRTRERGDTFGNDASVVGGDSIGDNSGQQSGNSGRINSPDNDSTSTPTVVDQPDPVVVQP